MRVLVLRFWFHGGFVVAFGFGRGVDFCFRFWGVGGVSKGFEGITRNTTMFTTRVVEGSVRDKGLEFRVPHC